MKKKYNSNPFAIKTDQQFYKFCKRLCEDHNSDLEAFRYALQFNKPILNLPDSKKPTLIYNFADMHILFTNNLHTLTKWMEEGEYEILRQVYNPRPKAPSRTYSHVSFSKLYADYDIDSIGYDAEIDIVRDFLDRWDVTHVPHRNRFTKTVDKQEK